MTMKRILHCTLIFMVLVTSGCDLIFGPDNSAQQNSNSKPTALPKHTIDFAGAAQDVEEALTKLTSPGKPGQSTKVKPVKDEIGSAIRKLGQEENLRDRCTDCTDDTKEKAIAVLASLNEISGKLGTDPKTEIADLSDDFKNELKRNLTDGAASLKELSSATPKTTQVPSPGPSPTQTDRGKTGTSTFWWDTLILSLQVVGGLVALVLLASVVSYLWKRAWKTVEFNVGQVVAAHVSASREAQPDYAPKLSSLSSAQTEMSSRLTELDTEVRSLARLVRESLATRRPDPSYGGFNYQSRVEEVAPKDEPEFPVSAVDYLGKMNRFANVVRPDFQNGILVNDPDGNGELVLIRDSRDETQSLFVVPRATQFQTKQDFYTYYQKYYDCVRPSAGDVWIIGPAVVEKVAGGWQLREKGMLEIR
jgi:hypothetical protein